MRQHALGKDILPLGFILLIIAAQALSTCTGPDLPDRVHALMPTSSIFAVGAVLDVVCAPPYYPETVFQLTCDSRGQWLGHLPDCSKNENKTEWWMLLLGLVGAIVIIPCILPRLYFTYFDTPSPARKLRPRRLSSETRHYQRKQMQSLEMQDMSGRHQQQQAMNAAYIGLYPSPLPPIKQRGTSVAGPADRAMM